MKQAYYFSKVPKGWREKSLISGFNSKYYFRLRIEEDQGEVKIEDSCGRMVPIFFPNLKKLKKTLTKVIKAVEKSYVY